MHEARHSTDEIDPIDYWTKEEACPRSTSNRTKIPGRISQDISTKRAGLRTGDMQRGWSRGQDGLELMIVLLARPKPPPLRPNQSSCGSLSQVTTTPSDEKPRKVDIAEYRNYPTKRNFKKGNSFMTMDEEGHWQESKDKCRKLLSERFTFFSDRVFESTCERVANQNEAKAIDKIARLVAPSAVDLADFGAEHLEKLVVTINEGWENSISVTHLVLSLTKLWDSTDRIYRNPGTLPEDWSFHRCGQPLYLVDLPCHQHFLFKHSMLPCNDRSTDVFWTAPVIGDRGQSVWDTVR